jgi:hypothetical protein
MKLFLTLALALLLTAPGAFAAPGKPTGHGPSGTGNASPVFQFSQITEATWYHLWLNGPSGTVHAEWYQATTTPCGGGSCSIDPGLNLPPGHYKWWIRAHNGGGQGLWSDEMGFDVGNQLPHVPIQLPTTPFRSVMWVDHLAFQAGTPSVQVSFDAVDSGVGSGTSGLIVEAGTGPGPRVVEQGLLVPSGLLVDGVRVCYELSDRRSYISQVRLEQLEDPPDRTRTKLVDVRGMPALGPICVDSARPSQAIDASTGSLRLQLGLNFPDPSANDRIVIRGVGLLVESDPNGPLQNEIRILWQRMNNLENTLGGHGHHYLTGAGNGHNNTTATTGAPIP